jgi:DNA-binding NarL/FixJ family response regulator
VVAVVADGLESRASDVEPQAGVPAAAQNGHIGAFIVDDEEDIRVLIRMIVKAANDGLFVSGEAANGTEALEAVDDLNPSVVVVDEMMPGMSGIETATRILHRRPGQRIILCSAHLDDDLRRQAEAVGVTLCLPKSSVASMAAAIRLVAGM